MSHEQLSGERHIPLLLHTDSSVAATELHTGYSQSTPVNPVEQLQLAGATQLPLPEQTDWDDDEMLLQM